MNTMLTVHDVDKALSAIAPRTLSESWDNDGVMLCRDGAKRVQRVLVMLEVNPAGAEYAAKEGYDLIVTHHPLIFRPFSSLSGDSYALFDTLMRADIPVLSYHTRLDVAEGGVNDTAVTLLGLTGIEPFGGEKGDAGRIGYLPEPMAPFEFAVHLKKVLGCGTVRASIFSDTERKIRRVAYVGGAGKSFWREAYAAGADAFVTGEAAHNTFIDCAQAGMCLFDCGHYYTENPVCIQLQGLLKNAFGQALSVDVYDVKSPYTDL